MKNLTKEMKNDEFEIKEIRADYWDGLPQVFIPLSKFVIGWLIFSYQGQAPEATGPLVPVVGNSSRCVV